MEIILPGKEVILQISLHRLFLIMKEPLGYHPIHSSRIVGSPSGTYNTPVVYSMLYLQGTFK